MCLFCGCKAKKLEKQTLTIEGMSCGHCKNAVEKAVRGLPGVMAAEVDLDKKTLTVEYDAGKSNLDAIKAAVADAGYTVA